MAGAENECLRREYLIKYEPASVHDQKVSLDRLHEDYIYTVVMMGRLADIKQEIFRSTLRYRHSISERRNQIEAQRHIYVSSAEVSSQRE